MPVSKTTRFQVLKRDGHTCRYCGASAPDVKLTVDHVIPAALGGSDKPDNLVAACVDCNAGKGASNPDSELVQQLSAEAATYALEMANKAALIKEELIAEADYLAEFEAEWNAWVKTATNEPHPLPRDYKTSVWRWQKQSIPMELFEYSIRVSMESTARDKFKYMCGVLYNRLRSADVSYTLVEPQTRIYTDAELVDAYEKGHRAGYANGADEWKGQELHEHKMTDPLARHIDMGLAFDAYKPFDFLCRKWDKAAARRWEASVG